MIPAFSRLTFFIFLTLSLCSLLQSAAPNEEFSAGFILFRRTENNSSKQIEFLLIKAKYSGDFWSFPKGHLKKNESNREAAIRELKEECGIDGSEIRIIEGFTRNLRYIIRNSKVKTVSLGLAELVNPEQNIKLSAEHISYRWLPQEEACTVAKFPNMQLLIKESHDYLIDNKL